MVFRFRSVRYALIAVCLGLTTLSYWVVDNIARTRSLDAFETITADSMSTLVERLSAYRQSLNGLSGLFAASHRVTQDEIDAYVSQIDMAANMPEVNGLGLIVSVQRAELPGFMAEARADGVPEFTIHPASDADTLFVVKYIAPRSDNTALPGLDIGFDRGWRASAIAARDTGLTQMTPLGQFTPDDKAEAGFLLLRPIYAPRASTVTAAERQAALIGWAFAPLISARFLEDFASLRTQLFEIQLFDGKGTNTGDLIYSSVANPDASTAFSKTAEIEVFGRIWTIHWQSTPEFDAAQPWRAPYVVLAIGLSLTLLIGLIFRMMARSERRVRSQVREKTRALRTREEEYRSVFENAHIGILTLDGAAVILRANETAIEGLGGQRDRIIGHPVEDILPEIDIALNGGKCFGPPPAPGMDERIFDYRQSQWRDVNGELRRTILLLDITEQEEHVAQIKETEKRWNLALKGAQIGVFDLDVTTGKSVVSDSWRRIMDVELEPDDFNPQSVFIDRVHPDDYKRLRASDDACLRGETVRSSCHYRVRFGEDEWRWMHSDGTVVDWDSNGRALRFVGAQTDVTEQMIAQNALALSEERFRLVFFHAPVGKAIAEGKYYFTAVNEAMCKFLGYTEEELLTKIRLRDVLDCEDLADIYNEIDLRREAGESSMQAEKQFILRDGTRGWGLISISWTMDESLGDLLFIVQINDISEIKEMERTKSEFVSTISHELRTPLTSIRGSLELMASAELAEFPDKRKRLLDIARQNSDRLLRLINDVLDLERIESRRFEFAHYDEDADELLTESCEINSPFAVKLNVSLEIAQLTGGATVSVDRNRFGQVMTNLISNACKFSDPAGTVRIGAEIEGGFVRFWVNNRGPGIPDSFRARVFTPFSQADGTDTRRVGGTGLGLNIAKQIVERMGGTIGFTSVVNEETTFWFTCPLSEEATADQRQVAG
ncbi:hypothetical protein GCM10017056_19160 [Seohaeicola zhoushanensis]|uniref:histidine kinase n=2 Tax=Seohaeicola zhoushanensis TaxID=1569283 RepID=A0A8J3GWY9_9RHOB|nr:hypothetical protein GCM10017056_19160 [Seohaeicola zhoushanensis]